MEVGEYWYVESDDKKFEDTAWLFLIVHECLFHGKKRFLGAKVRHKSRTPFYDEGQSIWFREDGSCVDSSFYARATCTPEFLEGINTKK